MSRGVGGTAVDLVGPSGVVYAFEPSCHFYKRLLANLELNGFQNVVAELMGPSDRNAIHKLLRTHSGGSIDYLPPIDYIAEEIQTLSLDEYVMQKGISGVDFIKIDVDGHEHHVLADAQRTLQRFLPAILVEVEPRTRIAAGTSPGEIMTFLVALGYRLFSEHEPKTPRNPNEIMAEMESTKTNTMNILCRV